MAPKREREDDAQGNQPGHIAKKQHIKIPPVYVYKYFGLKPLPKSSIGMLLERVDRYGYDEKKAIGDGNCQMRALSKLLHEKQKYHPFVRSEIVKELKKKPQMYMSFGVSFYPWMTNRRSFDSYVKWMSRDKHWGDFLTLYAAANLYRVRITVFCSYKNESVMEFAPENCLYKADIFLSYEYENEDYAHYNAVYPKTEIPSVDQHSPSPSDSPSMLDGLHAKWNSNVASPFKLFVTNISYQMDNHSLKTAFAKHAKVVSAEVIYGEDNHSLGYAYVEMEDKRAINKVIEALHGKILDGRKIYIKPHNPYDDLA